MQDSIFTKIIRGEIPSHKVYEDKNTLAFLDIYPVQPGHVLVIPKKQVEFVWDLEAKDYQALMTTVKKVALRMRSTLRKPYIHSRIVGTDVPHAHVQLIPFSTSTELRNEPDMEVEPDHTSLGKMAEKLKF